MYFKALLFKYGICPCFAVLVVTVWRLAKVAILSSKLQSKHRTSNLVKTVIRSTEPPLLPNACYLLAFFSVVVYFPVIKSFPLNKFFKVVVNFFNCLSCSNFKYWSAVIMSPLYIVIKSSCRVNHSI